MEQRPAFKSWWVLATIGLTVAGVSIIGSANELAPVVGLGLAVAAVVLHEWTTRRTAERAFSDREGMRRVSVGHENQAEALQMENVILETKVAELSARTRVITALGEMSDALQTATESVDAYASIAAYARVLFPRASGAICAATPARDLLEVVSSWGQPGTRSTFATTDCRALHSVRLNGAVDAQADDCLHVPNNALESHLCIPITSHGERFGIVFFGWPQGNATTEELATAPFRSTLATAFAKQVGLGLGNLRLKQMLHTQAIHDPLTGLHNRRFMEEELKRELERAAHRGSALSVLMLDVDLFKAFNDAHGHLAGDSLLRALAEQLQADIRKEDIAYRYGGEEFALVLPRATHARALIRAENIRDRVGSMVVDVRGQRLAGVTISVGVATFPEHGASPDALLRAADAALYAAKESGRDRTTSATPPLGPAAAQPGFHSGGQVHQLVSGRRA